ncbi:hypothetical protein [Nocardioides convexus]|nr:hypothetical protein [Nocardioides convexus]
MTLTFVLPLVHAPLVDQVLDQVLEPAEPPVPEVVPPAAGTPDSEPPGTL